MFYDSQRVLQSIQARPNAPPSSSSSDGNDRSSRGGPSASPNPRLSDKANAEADSMAQRFRESGHQELFAPPYDMLFEGSLEEARSVCIPARPSASASSSAIAARSGAAQLRWLLVNIQKDDEFTCHELNRDVWSHEMARAIVTSSFILWQQTYVDSSSSSSSNNPRQGAARMLGHGANGELDSHAQTFVTRYHVSAFPYLGILDPRTGAEVWSWAKNMRPQRQQQQQQRIHLDRLVEGLAAFLAEHPYPGSGADVASEAALALAVASGAVSGSKGAGAAKAEVVDLAGDGEGDGEGEAATVGKRKLAASLQQQQRQQQQEDDGTDDEELQRALRLSQEQSQQQSQQQVSHQQQHQQPLQPPVEGFPLHACAAMPLPLPLPAASGAGAGAGAGAVVALKLQLPPPSASVVVKLPTGAQTVGALLAHVGRAMAGAGAGAGTGAGTRVVRFEISYGHPLRRLSEQVRLQLQLQRSQDDVLAGAGAGAKEEAGMAGAGAELPLDVLGIGSGERLVAAVLEPVEV
jgi:hypothetical protein